MLAYVFWHWRNSTVGDHSYRDLLANFHETLATNAPDGFMKSVVFALPRLPWTTDLQPAFEDWYLLKDSATLDVINHAAVTGPCEESHNAVARQAAGGTAGLYRLRSGEEALANAKYVTWLSKPDGVSYPSFYSSMATPTSLPSVGLWQRQMTLGPTTEFAIYSDLRFDGFGTPSEIDRIWPR